jgi:Solute carrier family 12
MFGVLMNFLSSMEQLLSKLRINYSSFTLIEGCFDPPKEGTIRMHSKMLNGFLEGQNEHCFVSDQEREKLLEKTNLHLRLREMLREHSQKASFIVMSLPMPRLVRKTLARYFVILIAFSFSFQERGISATLHVLVGDVNAWYATVPPCSWQSDVGLDLQFLKAMTSPPLFAPSDLLFQL